MHNKLVQISIITKKKIKKLCLVAWSMQTLVVVVSDVTWLCLAAWSSFLCCEHIYDMIMIIWRPDDSTKTEMDANSELQEWDWNGGC